MGATLFGSGILLFETSKNKAQMASLKITPTDFMAAPLTSVTSLEQNKDDMKSRMELMIMKIQVEPTFMFDEFYNISIFIS